MCYRCILRLQITLRRIVLRCIVLHYIALHCITLHYVAQVRVGAQKRWHGVETSDASATCGSLVSDLQVMMQCNIIM